MAKLPDEILIDVSSMPCSHCGEVTEFGKATVKLNWDYPPRDTPVATPTGREGDNAV